MNLNQIKTAVRSGKTVHVGNSAYSVHLHVFPDGSEQWNILHSGGSCIGLTHQDGVTLNAGEGEFYVAPSVSVAFPALFVVADGAEVVSVDLVHDAGDLDWRRRKVLEASADAFSVEVVPLSLVLRASALEDLAKTYLHWRANAPLVTEASLGTMELMAKEALGV